MKQCIKLKALKALKALKTYGTIWIASSMLFFDMPSLPAECYCPDTCYTNPCCDEVFSTDVGGCGYQACRRCPVLAPAVALAVVALTGIIAVALQTDHSHNHAHNHRHHRNFNNNGF